MNLVGGHPTRVGGHRRGARSSRCPHGLVRAERQLMGDVRTPPIAPFPSPLCRRESRKSNRHRRNTVVGSEHDRGGGYPPARWSFRQYWPATDAPPCAVLVPSLRSPVSSTTTSHPAVCGASRIHEQQRQSAGVNLLRSHRDSARKNCSCCTAGRAPRPRPPPPAPVSVLFRSRGSASNPANVRERCKPRRPARTPSRATSAASPEVSPASGHLLRWPQRPPAGLVFITHP